MESSPLGMDWQFDTPPKVLYQAKRPFAQFARDEPVVEYGRSDAYIYGPQSPYPVRAGHSPASGNASTEQVECEKERPWSYMLNTLSVVSRIIVKVSTHPINRASWSTVYGAARHIFSKFERTDRACIAIEQAANGAKRRLVELTNRQVVPLSWEENKVRRHRDKVASCRDNERSSSSLQQTPPTTMQDLETPEGGYYMSGALTDADINQYSAPTYPQQLPGSWIESPVTDPWQYYNYNRCSTDVDSINTEATYEAMGNDSATSDIRNGSGNAWPYFGNSHNQIELRRMAGDDESIATSEGSLDQESSSASSTLPGDLSDMDCSGLESSDLPDTVRHELNQAQKYSYDNPRPDAVQRAAIDEFQAILEDDTLLSDHVMDEDRPATQWEKSSPTASDKLMSSPGSMQTPQQVSPATSQSSPLCTPQSSITTISSEGSYDSHGTTSPKSSPVWSSQGSPDQNYDRVNQESPVPRPNLNGSCLLPQPLPVAKEESPRKRVVFYVSPKTGKPVDKYKKYIKGESMDISYVSTSTDEDFSIHTDGSPSAQLYLSPTYQEQLEKQLVIQRKDREFLQSVTSAPATDHVPSPASLPLPPHTLTQITNGRTRQRRGATNFAVTANGSPMRLRSSSVKPAVLTNSSTDGKLVSTKQLLSGKENDNPLSQVDASAETPVSSNHNCGSNSHFTSTHTATFTSAKESLASGTETSLQKEHLPSNQADSTTLTSSTESSPVITLENGKDISSNEACSLSTQIDASDDSSDAPQTPAHVPRPFFRSGSPSCQLFSDDSSSSPDLIEISSSPENNAYEGTLDTGKDANPHDEGEVFLSTQVDASNAITILDPLLAEGTLAHGKDFTTASGRGSSSNQVDASAAATTLDPSLAKGTLVHGKDSTPTKNGDSPSNQVDALATPPTPNDVARQLDSLTVSGRRSSSRQATKIRKDAERRAAEKARLAAEKARKEKEEAEERARKEEERKKSGARRMPVEKIIQPLPEEWDKKVDKAMAEHMSKVIASSNSGTEITRRDIGKVLPQPGVPGEDPRGWLNDTIIQAYVETAVAHALETSGHKRGETPKMVALSTYFYPKLDKTGAASCDRWTKRSKIDGQKLKDVERVFMPVNQGGIHWTLLVISPKFKTIEYFDSFHGSYARVVRNAKDWVKFNLKDDFVEEEWTVVGEGGPQQSNGSDCGVFVSTTAKMITLGVDPMAYSHRDIPLQRRRMVAEIINGGFGGELETDVVFAD